MLGSNCSGTRDLIQFCHQKIFLLYWIVCNSESDEVWSLLLPSRHHCDFINYTVEPKATVCRWLMGVQTNLFSHTLQRNL